MLYQLSSGQGPTECERFVKKFYDYIADDTFVICNFNSSLYIDNGYRSIQFYAEKDLFEYLGTLKWTWKSNNSTWS